MKIVIDKHIPYIEGIFDTIAEVVYCEGKAIIPDVIKDADALIVRTRTQCDENLLRGSKVKYIGTATAGTDHVDHMYCDENEIAFQSAEGCNASSVRQYVASVIAKWAKVNNITDLRNKTIGIVGYGNIGTQITELGEQLGMKVMVNDPILQSMDDMTDEISSILESTLKKNNAITNNATKAITEFMELANNNNQMTWYSLQDIAQNADIITFHTPLTTDDEFPTYHLCDERLFETMEKKPLIINAARGGIIDEDALKDAIDNKKVSFVAIDCWENEPEIDLELLSIVNIATPHIAGYSADGKFNATKIIVEDLIEHFNLDIKFENSIKNSLSEMKTVHCSNENILDEFIKSYNIDEDSISLKENPDNFEKFRQAYRVRREQKYIIK